MAGKVFSILMLVAATIAVSSAADDRSSRVLIGDIIKDENLRGSLSSSNNHNLNRKLDNIDILDAMLNKEFFDINKDECLQVVNGTSTYTQCDIRHFPYCNGDRPNICFNRINRQDSFWPDKHPKYYIDYNRIHCYPDQVHGVDFTCSSCSPGRWCIPEGRCILDENLYHCWAAE